MLPIFRRSHTVVGVHPHLSLIAAVGISCSLGVASEAAGQGRADSQPRTGACETHADSNLLSRTLPLELLDHLEGVSRSIFVQAFLLGFLADDPCSTNPLVFDAQRLRDVKIEDIDSLRGRIPEARQVLDELRRAEIARADAARHADSVRFVHWTVDRLVRDLSVPTLDIAADRLREAVRKCVWNLPVCSRLEKARDETGRLRAVHDSINSMDREIDRLDAALAAAAEAVSETEQRAEPDTIAWRSELNGFRRIRTELETKVGLLGNQLQTTALELSGLLRVSPLVRTPLNPPITAILPTGSPVTVPPIATSGPAPAASPSLAIAATDFVIDRAKREIVTGLVVSLYSRARSDSLLIELFPDTWRLMRSLSGTASGSQTPRSLSAIEVGRVPLTSWRATLTNDYTGLPVRLLSTNPRYVCGENTTSEVAKATTDITFRTARDERLRMCKERLLTLRPLASAASRLLQGDPILQVVADLPDSVRAASTGTPADWRRLSQAVAIVAGLAEAYAVQGSVLGVDPHRHPYVLTARSLSQTSRSQRILFPRLLLVRAAGEGPIDTAADLTALGRSTESVARLLERIASRAERPELTRAEAAHAVQNAFDALHEAGSLARALGSGHVERTDSILDGWRNYGQVVQSLIAGNYGLAFARSLPLVEEVRGGQLSAPVTTFVALASSLSEAQDTDQMRRAFEAAASPVGGWQAKRQGIAGLGIAAYPGIGGSWEWLETHSGDPMNIGSRTRALGLALPVGVELQTGWPRQCWIACGFGLFVPFLDLGTALSYRLGGADEVNSEPNPSLRQIFAPGVFLTFSLTDTFPLSLLGGIQWVPGMREVELPSGPDPRSVTRFSISAGLDVNLFTLWSARIP